jgi:ureidoglycolate lyase
MAEVISLRPEPLTRERFAPYGDVIESSNLQANAMNEARFERFDDLCKVDVGDGRVSISVARCRAATSLPLRVDMVERHPLGSQAFVPLTRCRMVVVVAPRPQGFCDERQTGLQLPPRHLAYATHRV